MKFVQEDEVTDEAFRAIYLLRVCLKFLACPARFERATYALEGRNVLDTEVH